MAGPCSLGLFPARIPPRSGLDRHRRRRHQRPRRRHSLRRRPLLLVRRTQDRRRGGQSGAGRRSLLLLGEPLRLARRRHRAVRGSRRIGQPDRAGLHPRTPEGDPQRPHGQIRHVVPPRAQRRRLHGRPERRGGQRPCDGALHLPAGRASRRRGLPDQRPAAAFRQEPRRGDAFRRRQPARTSRLAEPRGARRRAGPDGPGHDALRR